MLIDGDTAIVLEAIHMDSPDGLDLGGISERTGLRTLEVVRAIERLERHGRVESIEAGRWATTMVSIDNPSLTASLKGQKIES